MARNLKAASSDSKDRFMISTLLNTARSRWARWAHSDWIATKLDKLQRRFLSALFPTIRKADESEASFSLGDSPMHRDGLGGLAGGVTFGGRTLASGLVTLNEDMTHMPGQHPF